MAPSKTRGPPSFPKQALVVSMPAANVATDRSTDSEDHSNSTINREVIMEIAIIMGFLVGVFVMLGGLILFFPYDKGI
jgi:hypothetical protein